MRILFVLLLTFSSKPAHALAALGYGVGADFSQIFDRFIQKALTPEGALIAGAIFLALYLFTRKA
jgi:hypothetical protein